VHGLIFILEVEVQFFILLHAAFLSHCPRYNSLRFCIAVTPTFSFSHISFVPWDMAGHAVYPIYHRLYVFDYKNGAVPRLPLPLGME
jgi:hypothetical protein